MASILVFGCISPNSQVSSSGPQTQPTSPNTSVSNQPTQPSPQHDVPSLNYTPIFYSSDNWQIRGYLYSSKASTPTKLILLLPMLDHTLEDYPQTLLWKLHEAIPDAIIMPIDMRGHGESVNQGTFDSFDSTGFLNMKNDVTSAKSYITRNYPSVNQVYVVGASIGSTAAINAAANDQSITKVVLLSPGVEYQEVNIQNSIRSYNKPLLFVVSREDSYSYSSVANLSALSPSTQKQVKIYSVGHGTEIFGNEGNGEENLEDLITNFLK